MHDLTGSEVLEGLPLEAVVENAEHWGSFHTPAQFINYLGHQTAQNSFYLQTFIQSERDLSNKALKNAQFLQFYNFVLLRYFQRTTGDPENIQNFHFYDMDKENQIDWFIDKFFINE
ncbi:MAG: hypothetical protein MAG795_00788 [Candidatus Woesearchaeota archaeon]|nr:hypothetical protein [Candidatus Woesearchaeota archaeon]